MDDIQRAIETQKSIYDVLDRTLINSDSTGFVCVSVDRIDDIKTAISAMQELQQYRQIGTVEEFAEIQNILMRDAPTLKKYRQIGTLEECREAMERRKKRKPNTRIVGPHDLQTIHYECPTCAKELAHDLRYKDIEKDEVYISGIRTQYCGECGQNILWEENDGEINMGR